MFGLLNLNKPAGCTSRDVVNSVVRLVGRKVKVGHAGTLDPIATGVLIVCVGPATRLLNMIHEHTKSYEADFLLGCRSDSDDIEGEIERVEIPADLDEERMRAALPEFRGLIQQVPPIYSAVKIGGKPAYKAARRGEEIELSAREVLVNRLELTAFTPQGFSLSMDCGTGTYVRSIGRDLARRLGTQAVMSQLVRSRIGPFTLATALDPQTLTRDELSASLISPLEMLTHFRQVEVNADEIRRLGCGQSLPWPDAMLPDSSPRERVLVLNQQQELFCIGENQQNRLAPTLVMKLGE